MSKSKVAKFVQILGVDWRDSACEDHLEESSDGSEAISYEQAAEIIGTAIGKPLRFVDESPDEVRARRVREGLPPVVVESALAIAAYRRAGGNTVTITNTDADLTGRPPRTVAEFAREHAAVFRGERY